MMVNVNMAFREMTVTVETVVKLRLVMFKMGSKVQFLANYLFLAPDKGFQTCKRCVSVSVSARPERTVQFSVKYLINV